MAKVFNRVCVQDLTITDGDASFTIERAKTYITSAERPDGTVRVFSRYWVDVPASIFAGEREGVS